MVARNRIVLSGVFGGGLEQWSCSMDYQVNGDSTTDPATVQDWADAAALYLEDGATLFPEITNIMSGVVQLTEVSVYGYGASGPAVASGLAGTSWYGLLTIRAPYSTALCVTKRTGIAGKRYRGRHYWPCPALIQNSDGSMVVDDDLPNEFRTMWLALGTTHPGPDIALPVVYSAVANAVTDVTSLAIGDVPDSQRNRRDALTETYSVSDPF